jgi:hypothetical protein
MDIKFSIIFYSSRLPVMISSFNIASFIKEPSLLAKLLYAVSLLSLVKASLDSLENLFFSI